jgi:hypothetical protein
MISLCPGCNAKGMAEDHQGTGAAQAAGAGVGQVNMGVELPRSTQAQGLYDQLVPGLQS